jgi:hypothetical protein
MVVYTCNPCIREGEAGPLWIWGQPGLHNEFKVRLDYGVRPCLKNNNKKILDLLQIFIAKAIHLY